MLFNYWGEQAVHSLTLTSIRIVCRVQKAEHIAEDSGFFFFFNPFFLVIFQIGGCRKHSYFLVFNSAGIRNVSIEPQQAVYFSVYSGVHNETNLSKIAKPFLMHF